jgi:hypothetical protein
MPASSPLNESPPTIAVDDRTADGRDPVLTAADRQSAADPGISPAEQLAAERTERRRQRAATPHTPAGGAMRARLHERSTESRSAVTSPGLMTLRDSVSVTLIAVLAAGGVLGAILGALSAAGWVIGLLVAGLTVVLSALVRRYSRSA